MNIDLYELRFRLINRQLQLVGHLWYLDQCDLYDVDVSEVERGFKMDFINF